MEKCEIEEMEKRINDLQERISMNNHDIEWGDDSYSKRISRMDNTFCKGRIRELTRKLNTSENKP